MKTSQILNILLAVALVILSIKIVIDGKDNANNVVHEEGAIETIMTRTSIRDFQNKPVEEEKVETMLRAAMAAPTAVNKQPWRFIVIKEKKTLKAISENFNSMKMAEKAPLAIVVCGDLKATLDGEGADYWVQDASAATENLLLAAHSLGLGAVWCGIYPIKQRVGLLKEMLDIPDDIIPLNVIPIGYPAENPEPKDKWNPSKIHYEKWTGTEN
jgi:nitroreductase